MILKYLCAVNIKIKGNIIKKPAVFASKHQSLLEAFILYYYLKSPAFILKKELLKIPIFGLCIKWLDLIFIDRNAGFAAIRTMQKTSLKILNSGKPIVIFPEGTRRPPGEKTKYFWGLATLCFENIPIVPVALNTGYILDKNSFNIKSGTITVSFLKPIYPTKTNNKREIVSKVAEAIENEMKQLK